MFYSIKGFDFNKIYRIKIEKRGFGKDAYRRNRSASRISRRKNKI